MGPGERAYIDTAGVVARMATAGTRGCGAVVVPTILVPVHHDVEEDRGVGPVGGAKVAAVHGCRVEVSDNLPGGREKYGHKVARDAAS